MKELLYRPSWQSLRVSFLQENRNDGGWTTLEGTSRNLQKMIEYVDFGPATDSTGLAYLAACNEGARMGWKGEHEHACRLYRAINCLNAVRMGNSGQGQKGSRHDVMVLDIRDFFQRQQTIMYHRYLSYCEARWDWRVVRTELEQMWRDDHIGEFEQVYDNLNKRIKTSDRRTSTAQTLTNRKDLVTFVEIMRQVKGE